jgi:hypothetical protein
MLLGPTALKRPATPRAFALNGAAILRAGGFNIRTALFPNSEPGAWYDPSDLTTMFQDRAGTTPVTAPGQTVGGVLDLSRGLVKSKTTVPVLSTTEGGGGTTIVQSGNVFTFTAAAAADGRLLNGHFTLGRRTFVRATVSGTGIAQIFAGNAAGGVATPGGGSVTVSTGNTVANQTYLWVRAGSGGFTGTITIEEIFEQAGNHLVANSDAARGLYGIEPLGGRRNLYERTDDFGNAYWTKTALTVSSDSIAVSSGLAGAADKITETATTTTHIVYKTAGLSVGAGTYTGQIKAKAGERSRLLMGIYNGSNYELAQFDLAGGTVVQEHVPGMASIEDLGNGEYLCTVTRAIGAVTSYLTFGPHTSTDVANLNPAGFHTYAGSDGNGIYVWDVQFELSATATAYQRVVTAQEVTEAGVPSLSYILHDGSDDGYVTGTITPGTDKVQVFAGVRNLSNAAAGIIAELSATVNTNAGSFFHLAAATVNGPYQVSARGSTASNISQASTTANLSVPNTGVVTGLHDIPGDSSIVRLNGVASAAGTFDKGTGNFLAFPLYIGRRGGTTLPFNGRLYSLILRFGDNLPTNTIEQVEAWVAGKTGVTL